MIKVYGMHDCPYCAYIEEQIQGNEDFEYHDIGQSVSDLHAFLDLRDHDPAFIPYKEEGDIGIPCFVKEDGTVTIEPSEVGLVSLSEANKTCGIHGC